MVESTTSPSCGSAMVIRRCRETNELGSGTSYTMVGLLVEG